MAGCVDHELKACVPGQGVNLDLGVPSLYRGCQCLGFCEFDSGSTCTCTCPYSKDRLLTPLYLEETSSPILECNSNCSCDRDCLNRLSQCDPGRHLTIVTTEKKGLGVVTRTPLQKGSFVGEYVGEIISSSASKDRLESLNSTAECYIVQYHEHWDDRVVTTNIDATYRGNMTRFINHSCDPNLVMVPVRSDSIVPRLCLFTSKDICAGDELCFNYSGRASSVDSEQVPVGNKKCFCGSSACIGYLPFET